MVHGSAALFTQLLQCTVTLIYTFVCRFFPFVPHFVWNGRRVLIFCLIVELIIFVHGNYSFMCSHFYVQIPFKISLFPDISTTCISHRYYLNIKDTSLLPKHKRQLNLSVPLLIPSNFQTPSFSQAITSLLFLGLVRIHLSTSSFQYKYS
jgi:hypothetical protein